MKKSLGFFIALQSISLSYVLFINILSFGFLLKLVMPHFNGCFTLISFLAWVILDKLTSETFVFCLSLIFSTNYYFVGYDSPFQQYLYAHSKEILSSSSGPQTN